MAEAKFITLEGGEGSGKTTQARLLVERLRKTGLSVIQTREPGGTPRAEAIRDLLLSGKAKEYGPMAETALIFAARESHLELVIRPALKRGSWVICDRFSDSTRAYQGAGAGVPRLVIDTLDEAVVGATQPDLTLIFDVPAEIGLQRAMTRQELAQLGQGAQSPTPGHGLDRFETMNLSFHSTLREEFLEIAKEEPGRCIVIDAGQPLDKVALDTWIAVRQRYNLS